MAAMQGWRGALVASALVLGYLALVPAFLNDPLVTRVYYLRQDAIGAAVYIAALALAALMATTFVSPWVMKRMPRPGLVAAVAGGLVMLLWAGTFWIMLDYPLTRDELMVGFDGAIFSTGKLAQPVAPEWRAFVPALVPEFLFNIAGDRALISNYMPGNALMRAGFDAFGAPQLLNPLLAGLGFVAMWDAARRVFADCPAAVWVVLAGYLLSAQVLVNAMTAYAMTAHLALNAIWLALFLRDRPWGHALAMAIGVWTIGLHQIVFHPLFVGPIILTLLASRRWGLFAIYAAVYAAALVGWMLYPSLILSTVGASSAASAANAGTGNVLADFVMERVVPLVADPNPYTVPLMIYNLLRFFVWMPAFCLPLLLWARKPARRGDMLAIGLFASLAVTTAAVIVLLPYQGHGWGYRYWQALIPGILLLCGFGFREWYATERRAAKTATQVLAAATCLVIPFLLVAAHRFVQPYHQLTQLLNRQTVTFVILQTDPPGSAIDQVRNRADLTNRPLIFASNALTMAQVDELCRRGSIAFVRKDRFQLVPFGPTVPGSGRHYDELERQVKASPCWRPVNS